MSSSIEQGFSVSLPVIVTDGPGPTLDTTTPLTAVSAGNSALRVVYPDPTPGIDNPARSIRVDAIAPGSAGVQYTCDGHASGFSIPFTVTAPVNRGTATFGTPSAPFPTPTA